MADDQVITVRWATNYREVCARFIGELIFVRTIDGRRIGGVLESIHDRWLMIDSEPVPFDEVWKLYSAREVIS